VCENARPVSPLDGESLRAHVDSTGAAVFPRVLSWICPVPPHIVESPPEHTMNGRLGRFDKTGSQLCGFVRTRSGQPHWSGRVRGAAANALSLCLWPISFKNHPKIAEIINATSQKWTTLRQHKWALAGYFTDNAPRSVKFMWPKHGYEKKHEKNTIREQLPVYGTIDKFLESNKNRVSYEFPDSLRFTPNSINATWNFRVANAILQGELRIYAWQWSWNSQRS